MYKKMTKSHESNVTSVKPPRPHFTLRSNEKSSINKYIFNLHITLLYIYHEDYFKSFTDINIYLKDVKKKICIVTLNLANLNNPF